MLRSHRSLHSQGRMHLLLTGMLLVLALVLAACGGADAPAADAPAAEAPAAEAPAEEERLGSTLIGDIEGPEIITDESAFPTSFSEAPMLAEKVTAGDLPPVEERLPVPSDLLVIQPLDEIGIYGGTWRRGFTGPGDGQNGHRVAGGDRFVHWDADEFPKVVPNLAKGWEINEDSTEITLFLREGAKWSDGQPFTANDVMFWYEHMYQNSELVPVRSPFFNIDAGANLEMVDDYTLRFTFAQPNSLFLEVLVHDGVNN